MAQRPKPVGCRRSLFLHLHLEPCGPYTLSRRLRVAPAIVEGPVALPLPLIRTLTLTLTLTLTPTTYQNPKVTPGHLSKHKPNPARPSGT